MASEPKTAKAKKAARRRPGRRPVPEEQQRQRLLDAAERTFERNRYEASSVQDIVREAGMSTRSFYQFFASKDDLVSALARERAEDFVRELRAVLRRTEDVIATLGEILQMYLEKLPVVVLDLDRMGGAAAQTIRAFRTEYRDKIHQDLYRGLCALAHEGKIRGEPNETALELVIAGVETITIQYHSQGRREELLALHPQLFRAVQVLFAPLLPQRGRT